MRGSFPDRRSNSTPKSETRCPSVWGLGRVCGETAATLLDQIQACDAVRVAGDAPPCRVVYLKSHVRTRQWFKQGQTFLWQDGDNNELVKYGPAKTKKKVRPLGKGR